MIQSLSKPGSWASSATASASRRAVLGLQMDGDEVERRLHAADLGRHLVERRIAVEHLAVDRLEAEIIELTAVNLEPALDFVRPGFCRHPDRALVPHYRRDLSF